jgi:hypothetical protein
MDAAGLTEISRILIRTADGSVRDLLQAAAREYIGLLRCRKAFRSPVFYWLD